MSDLTTSCFSSRGELGRKRTKARRFHLREERRLARLPPPSVLERLFRPEQPKREAAAAG